MAQTRIDPIEDLKATQKKRAAWGDLCPQPVQETVVHKKDLSSAEISCLDRTSSTAHKALAQTEFASNTDIMKSRVDISLTKPAGANAVEEAARSVGIAGQKKLESLFDLSGNLEKQKETSERPELAPPKDAPSKNYLKLVLQMHGAMEKIITDCMNHCEIDAQKNLEELEKLREKKVQAVEQNAKELAQKQSWNTIQTMAAYITYASSMAIGATTGGTAGFLLLLAGSIGVAGNIAKDTGLLRTLVAHFNKSAETERQTLESMELALALIPLGLGLVGGSFANPSLAPTAFLWMTAALSASSKLGESWSIRKQEYLLADLETLDSAIFRLREDIKKDFHNEDSSFDMAKRITKEVSDLIANAELNLG